MGMPERTALYRVYGTPDVLLYIGISKDFGTRWKQHAKTQPWWGVHERMTVEWHGSRESAEAAERAAIRAERPKHNIMHNWREVGRKGPPIAGFLADEAIAQVAHAAARELRDPELKDRLFIAIVRALAP